MSMMNIGYSDLSDFHTLATVAAAQSEGISTPSQQQPTNSNTNSSSNQMKLNNSNNNSLSQMNMMGSGSGSSYGKSFAGSSFNNSNNNSSSSTTRYTNNNNGQQQQQSNTIRNLLASKTPLIDSAAMSSSGQQHQSTIDSMSNKIYMTMNSNNNNNNNNFAPTMARRSASVSNAESGKKIRANTGSLTTDQTIHQFQQQQQQTINALLSAAMEQQQQQQQNQFDLMTAAAVNVKQLQPNKQPINKRGGKNILNSGKNNQLIQTSSTTNNNYVDTNLLMNAMDQNDVLNLSTRSARPTMAMKKVPPPPPPPNGRLNSFNHTKSSETIYFNGDMQPHTYANQIMANSESTSNSNSTSSPLSSPTNNQQQHQQQQQYSMLSKQQRSMDNDLTKSNLMKLNESNEQQQQQNSYASASRGISRSNSVNSLNTLNDASLSTAEQKRRCNIQYGFDRLQVLVPSLRDGKNSKASKAAMLQKTSEYIKQLQEVSQKRMNEIDGCKREIAELSDRITECQNMLPANGVSITGNLNKTELFEKKFNAYIRERTMSDWRFYLFSFVVKPLFDSFIVTVNTASREDMEKTFNDWINKYCNLAQLRPSKFLLSILIFFIY